MYELVLCIGITWTGCGSQEIVKFPDKDSCFENLDHVKLGGSNNQGQSKTLAYCRPEQKNNLSPSPATMHFP